MNTKALNRYGELVDRSGSCAIVIMLVGKNKRLFIKFI